MTALAHRGGFAARQASFAPDPAKRAMVAKVQIAKKQLGLDDGDYRAILERVTGETSSAKLDIRQLDAVLVELKRLGFMAVSAKPGRPRAADHPSAKKARALLISLQLLGVIRDASEGALEAFARRQMGCERFQWADQQQCYKLIEALKAIATRNGWDQSTAGEDDPVRALKERLCAAILRRMIALGAAPAGRRLRDEVAADYGLRRIGDLTHAELERLSARLGKRLSDHVADGYYKD